jgi:hypothetical protein
MQQVEINNPSLAVIGLALVGIFLEFMLLGFAFLGILSQIAHSCIK